MSPSRSGFRSETPPGSANKGGRSVTFCLTWSRASYVAAEKAFLASLWGYFRARDARQALAATPWTPRDTYMNAIRYLRVCMTVSM